MQQYTKTIQ